MGHLGNLYFVFEILAAEAMFVYAYPRRKGFPARIAVALLFIVTLAYFLPVMGPDRYGRVELLLRFLSLWGLTVAGLAFCFRASPAAILGAASAAYAVQHFSFKFLQILGVFFAEPFSAIQPRVVTRAFVLELMTFPFPYALAFFLFARPAAKNAYYDSVDNRFMIMSALTVCFCVVLNRFTDFPKTDAAVISLSLYAMACTALALYIQYTLQRFYRARQENRLINELLLEKQKSYETSRRNAELLNIKYHDLKYALSKLGGQLSGEDLARMKSAVDSYDSSIRTGNEPLDILLSERMIKCREQNIRMTYFGNGGILSFMSSADTYTLFGNAVDNAIEAAEKVSEPEKRLISIVVENRADYVCASVMNYFDGTLSMENGLPKTTKKTEQGYHGYGMKSMRLIAERYGGDIRINANGDLFTLGMYFLPEGKSS